jgi:hypothetical protein
MEAQQGEPERARGLIQECLKVSPNNTQALDIWRHLELAEGNTAEANKLARRNSKAQARAKARLEAGATFSAGKVAETDDSSGDHAVLTGRDSSVLGQAIVAGETRMIASARRLFKLALDEAQTLLTEDEQAAASLAATLGWCRMELRYRYPDRARQVLYGALEHWPEESTLLEQLVRLASTVESNRSFS